MTTATSERRLSIEEFHDAFGDREGRWELVEGVPVMSPSESPTNLAAAFALGALLLPHLGNRYRYEPHSDLHLVRGRRPTVRTPDLLVRRNPDGGDPVQGDLDGVVLVVEVLSPSTARTDLVAKRREYARAGIPSYLVVDVRECTTLTLFEGLSQEAYADPTGDGSSVTMRLDDVDVTITAGEVDRLLGRRAPSSASSDEDR